MASGLEIELDAAVVAAAGIIGAMTERTAPGPGAIACPFVAFEGDRDERSNRPDHRHRCYAEVRPAPRAAAHQESFCLSPGFAACPSFQDWARRESARARVAAASSAAAVDLAGLARGSTDRPSKADIDDAGLVDDAGLAGDAELADGADGGAPDTGLAAWTGHASDTGSDASESPIRNPQRDWAAPPPWAVPSGPSSDESAPPGFLTSRQRRTPGDALETEAAGLVGSRWLRDVVPGETLGDKVLDPLHKPADDDLERSLAEDRVARDRLARPGEGRAAAIASAASAAAAASARTGADMGPAAGGAPPARRSASLPTSPRLPDIPRRPIERDTAGPAWERPQRNEAFPTLKTRMRLPSLSRLTLATLALVVAAIVLFSAPFILKLVGGGGGGDVGATPSPTSAPSVSLPPTEPPAPTAKVYVVKAKDTISTIAARFGLTVEELLAANKQVKNPDKIAIGDELIIPTAAPSEIISGASPSP